MTASSVPYQTLEGAAGPAGMVKSGPDVPQQWLSHFSGQQNPTEGSFEQKLWTPPPSFLIQRILGCSKMVLGEPFFRTEFPNPLKV